MIGSKKIDIIFQLFSKPMGNMAQGLRHAFTPRFATQFRPGSTQGRDPLTGRAIGGSIGDALLPGVPKANTIVKKVDDLFGGATEKRRFKYEYLGLMFAAMNLQKTFKSWLTPAASLAGIFELINTILIILFLPIILLLLPHIGGLVKYVAELDDEIKLVIGAFVLAGFVVMTIIVAVVMAVLALSGLVVAIGAGKVAIAGIIAGLTVLAIAISFIAGLLLMLGGKETSTRMFGGAIAGAALGAAFGPVGMIAGAGVGAAGGYAVGAFASGGLVDRPTVALLGEQGPEVVIPVGSTSNIVNVDANVASGIDIDILARSIAAKIGTMYDSKRVGFTSV
jgi:hypothetical protein